MPVGEVGGGGIPVVIVVVIGDPGPWLVAVGLLRVGWGSAIEVLGDADGLDPVGYLVDAVVVGEGCCDVAGAAGSGLGPWGPAVVTRTTQAAQRSNARRVQMFGSGTGASHTTTTSPGRVTIPEPDWRPDAPTARTPTNATTSRRSRTRTHRPPRPSDPQAPEPATTPQSVPSR